MKATPGSTANVLAKSARTGGGAKQAVRALLKFKKQMVKARAAQASRSDASVPPLTETRIGQMEHVMTILTAIPSGGVLLLTYKGASMPMTESGGGLLEKGEALAFASSVALLSWVAWYFVFGLVARLHGKRLAGAILGAVAFVTALTAINSQFLTLGLGGGMAAKHSMSDTAASYEATIKHSAERVGSARRILPAIRVEADRFFKAQQREISGGSRTGQRGAGKVSDALGQIGGQLGNLSNEIEAGLAKADVVQQRLTNALSEMKKQVFKQGPIGPRMETISSIADRIDADLTLLGQFDYRISIRAGLASLEKLAFSQTQSTSNFEKVQNAELAQIAAMAQPVAEALRAALAELDAGPAEPPPPTRPVDPMTATKIYWKELLPFWIAAIFLDVSPGFLLIILIAARREVEGMAGTAARNRGAP